MGSMDSVCGIRGSGCVEGSLGKVRGLTYDLPITQVAQSGHLSQTCTSLYTISQDQPLLPQAGSAFPCGSNPALLLCLEHPSLPGTLGGSKSQLKAHLPRLELSPVALKRT